MNSFTETVLGAAIKSYGFSADVDSKVTLFKLFHVALVTHFPDGSNVNEISISSNLPEDRQKLWQLHIRNIYHIIEKEITGLNKQPNRGQTNPTICHVFVQMAATLCATVIEI